MISELSVRDTQRDDPPQPSQAVEPAAEVRSRHACRFCEAPLTHPFVDLGMSPLCESFLGPEQLDAMEPFYPLTALRLPSVLAGPTPAVRERGAYFQRVRILLLVL